MAKEIAKFSLQQHIVVQGLKNIYIKDVKCCELDV